MNDIPINRRTALKFGGALTAGALLTETAAADHGDFHPDAAVLAADLFLPGVGPERFRNITVDPKTGRKIEIRGAVVFKVGESDALGGGPFTVMEEDGTVTADGLWTANRVEEFTPYGPFPDHPAFPDSWKGGLIELKTKFDPKPPGTTNGKMIIECHIGTDDDDEPEFGTQGVRVGRYDEVEEFGTVFNHSADLD